MKKITAAEAAFGSVVPRLLGVVERATARAHRQAKAVMRPHEQSSFANEVKRWEWQIKSMEPEIGFVLTDYGRKQMRFYLTHLDKARKRWETASEGARNEAQELEQIAWELENEPANISRLDDEKQQLEFLLALRGLGDQFLSVADRKIVAEAHARCQHLADEQAGISHGAEDEAAEITLAAAEEYLPAAGAIEFSDRDESVVSRLAQRKYDPPDAYSLNLVAQQLSLVGGFDSLLCLALLRGVESFPHQTNTARQVLRSMRGRALLCDEVGLGKTIEAGLILKEYLVRGLARKVLVLAPPALVSQWREEMSDKFGIDFVTHDDPAFRALGEEAWAKTDRVIASIHTAKTAPHNELIQKTPYDIIIVDEAHHLKNRATVSWKFVNGLKSRYLLLLTATPVQNNLDELFNLITLLSPGQLKTAAAFRREFVQRHDPRKPRNRTKLRELLMDVMVRNTRSQVSVALPPRRAYTLRMALSPAERGLYDAVSAFVRKEYRGRSTERFVAQMLQAEVGSSAAALHSTLEGMRQRSGHKNRSMDDLVERAAATSSSAKTVALLELLHRHSDKMLVFTRYRETQRTLVQALEEAGLPPATFGGQMSPSEKDHQVKAFASDRRVMVSTDVGSEGRNLQFCHTIVNYDLPWNPMLIEQRVGRVHRIGQTEPVHIFNLAAHDTVEDYILEVLDSKINMFELVVGEVGEILGSLDEDKEFEDLVMDLWMQAGSAPEARDAFDQLGDQLVEARRKYLEARTYDEELFSEDFVAEE